MSETEIIGDTSFRRRKCGGWIALFEGESLRFGVTGADQAEVEEKLRAALERWRRVMSMPANAGD